MNRLRGKTWIVVLVSVLLTTMFLGMAGVVGYLVMERGGGGCSIFNRKNQEVLNVMTQYEAYMSAADRRIEALNRELETCEITDADGFWSSAGKVAKVVGCLKQMKACAVETRDNLQRINVYSCPPDFVSAWTVFVQKFDGIVSVFDRATTFNWGAVSAWSELSAMGDEVGVELEQLNNNMLEIAESYGYEHPEAGGNVDFFEGVK